jgi:hypothetical protein
MKFKTLLLITALNPLYAVADSSNHYSHISKADSKTIGQCEIEIINSSTQYVTVYGTFEDGSPLTPFGAFPDNSSHFISLFYNGYCHPHMFLDILDVYGAHIYTAYTAPNKTIRIVPYLTNQVKVTFK